MATNDFRKRVVKACDRCRMKKCKCDGGFPCGKCVKLDLVCQYRDRKRYRSRVVPKGYVDFLEEQQERFAAGVWELYGRLQKATGRTQPPVHQPNDNLSVHDILMSLDMSNASPICFKISTKMQCGGCGHNTDVKTHLESYEGLARTTSAQSVSDATDSEDAPNSALSTVSSMTTAETHSDEPMDLQGHIQHVVNDSPPPAATHPAGPSWDDMTGPSNAHAADQWPMDMTSNMMLPSQERSAFEDFQLYPMWDFTTDTAVFMPWQMDPTRVGEASGWCM